MASSVNGTQPTSKVVSHKDTLTQSLPFATEDQSNWWLDCGFFFARLLDLAEYTVHQQYQHLLFFHRYMIPHFGPYPPQWKTVSNKSGLPIVFSLNFQQKGNPVVRVSFEPVSESSGSAEDPLNKKPFDELLSRFVKDGTENFDTALLDRLSNELFALDAEVASIPGIADFPIKTHTGLGFDFKNEDTVIKLYVHPRWKSLASGIPVRHLIWHSIDALIDEMDAKQAFDIVHEFLTERALYDLRTFLSWDCRPLSDSRLKFYGLTNDVDLAEIEDIWTMGGRLTDETATEGLKHVRNLWKLLDINEKPRHYSGDTEAHLNFGPQDHLMPMFWNYEVNSGSERPSPKVYIPVYGENDLKVAVALSNFFESLGWEEKGRSYVETLKTIFPAQDISQTSDLQTLISFAYTLDKGIYVSVYYHSTTSYPGPE
ncbi:aromatic prenyltransferase [Aspergillus crustosus]